MAGVKRVLIGLLVVAACILLALCDRNALAVWLLEKVALAESLGPAGFGYYAAAFILATFLFVPTVSLEMLGGLIFVRNYGLPVAIAVTGGSKLAAMSVHFMLGKSLLHGLVKEKVLPRFPIFQAIGEVAEKEPYKATLVIRFSPVPTIAKNLGLAALGIPYVAFLLVTALFALPWTAAGVLAGSTLTSLPEILDGRGREKLSELMRPYTQNPFVVGVGSVVCVGLLVAASLGAKRAYNEVIAASAEKAEKAQ